MKNYQWYAASSLVLIIIIIIMKLSEHQKFEINILNYTLIFIVIRDKKFYFNEYFV